MFTGAASILQRVVSRNSTAKQALEFCIPVGIAYLHARSAPGGRPRGRAWARARFPFVPAAGKEKIELFNAVSAQSALSHALHTGRYAPVPTLPSYF